MARLRHKVTEPPPPPAGGVRAATFALLLDTAMALIQRDGHIPSVAEVATRSVVSRATAYRYFPTRSALVTAVIEASLGPVRTIASDDASGRERVRELFMRTFPRFTEFEPQLRAAAQLSLEQAALERAGLLEEEPYRRGHRIRILEHAIAPLAPQLTAALRDRLHRALSIVYGIEPYIILKDIWGLPDREVERIALWMADALIDAALRDGGIAEPLTAVPLTAPTPRSAVASVATRKADPHPPAWYDQQYNSRARIPDHPAILQRWFDRSAQARSSLPCDLDLAYGDAPNERLDVFYPALAQPGAPVLVYIHGGYWRALDKQDQSFVAAPFVQRGAVVVLPNYALAPAVTVAHIVLQMVQAVAWVYSNIERYGGDPRRIVVAGHSAGAHLAAMMLACRWPDVVPARGDAALPADVVQSALCVSGVYDLAPLRRAPFLAGDLNLSEAEAQRLSPAGLPAPPQGRLLALVGGDESQEFQRQNRLIASAWGAATVPVCESVPGRHHMNVLHDLAEPGTRVHTLALGLLGLA
jgi:acetyl esterase/lipase/AcrR family transcriptional regulator